MRPEAQRRPFLRRSELAHREHFVALLYETWTLITALTASDTTR
jgi:hypothetical protein